MKGKKKKGEQSCWQRSASPARGPRCLGLVHHGRQSHLQIRRETLKECKWERKRERLREGENRRRGEKKGEQATLTMHAQTHTYAQLLHIHKPVFGYEDKRISRFFSRLKQNRLLTCVNLLQHTSLKPSRNNSSRSPESFIQGTCGALYDPNTNGTRNHSDVPPTQWLHAWREFWEPFIQFKGSLNSIINAAVMSITYASITSLMNYTRNVMMLSDIL